MNSTISVELVNSIFSDISEYTLNQKFSKVAQNTPSNYKDEKYQGDTSERSVVYNLNEGDLHLKLTFESDSYGNNETLKNAKLVRPVTKQITDFE